LDYTIEIIRIEFIDPSLGVWASTSGEEKYYEVKILLENKLETKAKHITTELKNEKI